MVIFDYHAIKNCLNFLHIIKWIPNGKKQKSLCNFCPFFISQKLKKTYRWGCKMVQQSIKNSLVFLQKVNIITLWPSSSALSTYPRELKAGTQEFVHPIPMSTAALAAIANLHIHQQMSWYTQFGSSHSGILFSIGPWSERVREPVWGYVSRTWIGVGIEVDWHPLKWKPPYRWHLHPAHSAPAPLLDLASSFLWEIVSPHLSVHVQGPQGQLCPVNQSIFFPLAQCGRGRNRHVAQVRWESSLGLWNTSRVALSVL